MIDNFCSLIEHERFLFLVGVDKHRWNVALIPQNKVLQERDGSCYGVFSVHSLFMRVLKLFVSIAMISKAVRNFRKWEAADRAVLNKRGTEEFDTLGLWIYF